MTDEGIPRFPLTWPRGRKRTPPGMRTGAPFKTSPDKALQGLMRELSLLGAKGIILSSNLKLRNDGYPYTQQPNIADQGIAVYFKRKGKDMAFACDKYLRRENNIHAIALTIGALRGIERWGTGEMVEQSFAGFLQLTGPTVRTWRAILGFLESDFPTIEQVERRYRELMRSEHPDQGGDGFEAVELNLARDEARKELG